MKQLFTVKDPIPDMKYLIDQEGNAYISLKVDTKGTLAPHYTLTPITEKRVDFPEPLTGNLSVYTQRIAEETSKRYALVQAKELLEKEGYTVLLNKKSLTCTPKYLIPVDEELLLVLDQPKPEGDFHSHWVVGGVPRKTFIDLVTDSSTLPKVSVYNEEYFLRWQQEIFIWEWFKETHGENLAQQMLQVLLNENTLLAQHFVL